MIPRCFTKKLLKHLLCDLPIHLASSSVFSCTPARTDSGCSILMGADSIHQASGGLPPNRSVAVGKAANFKRALVHPLAMLSRKHARGEGIPDSPM